MRGASFIFLSAMLEPIVESSSAQSAVEQNISFSGSVIKMHGLEQALNDWRDGLSARGYETAWKPDQSAYEGGGLGNVMVLYFSTNVKANQTSIGFQGCNSQSGAYAGVLEFNLREVSPPTTLFCLVEIVDETGKHSRESVDYNRGMVADNMFSALVPLFHGYEMSEDGRTLSLTDKDNIVLVVATKGAAK